LHPEILGCGRFGECFIAFGFPDHSFCLCAHHLLGTGYQRIRHDCAFSGHAVPEKLLAGGLMITFIDGILPVLLGLIFLKPFLDVMMNGNPES